jgi:hypothetical protein
LPLQASVPRENYLIFGRIDNYALALQKFDSARIGHGKDILKIRMWEMETGKKVKLNTQPRITNSIKDIADFEVWTGRPSEEFYDPQKN